MTIGERIRFFRKRLGITQDELAKRAELHPVSIRKYETNKMVPQYDQIEKLATALEINSSALSGMNYARFRLHTIGDLMGLLITLCDSEVLRIVGQRNEAGMIEADSAMICVNSTVSQFFSLNLTEKPASQIPLKDISAKFCNGKLLEDLLVWENARYLYRYYNYRLMHRASREDTELMYEAEVKKEYAELELQQSTERIAWPDGEVGDICFP